MSSAVVFMSAIAQENLRFFGKLGLIFMTELARSSRRRKDVEMEMIFLFIMRSIVSIIILFRVVS